jgi:flagellar hook-associated protein 2
MPTVSVSGFGSGIDVDSLINGLVQANSVTLNSIQTQADSFRTASTHLSSVGSALSSLATAADAISSTTGIASFTASSSNSAIVASAAGNATAASYSVQVNALAREQRTYSAQFSSNSGPAGQTGSINVKVGTSGTPFTVNVAATDSLDTIATQINNNANAAGVRVNASVIYDGTGYRLSVRGLDTGAANAVTLTETGTNFDLNGNGSSPTGGRTIAAADASLTVDGIAVTRSSNQISGVIPGVTLALTDTTTTAATVKVAGDSTALQTKVTAMVNAYNSVISSIHGLSGFGTTKASDPTLAADSTLRTVNDRLTALVGGLGQATGTYRTLADVGINLNQDGTLRVDTAKLSAAVASDPDGVTKLLARPPGATKGGMMADLEDLAKNLTATNTGILVTHATSFTTQAKQLDVRATAEQTRLDNYADRLRTQLTAMNDSIGTMQTQFASLSKLFG